MLFRRVHQNSSTIGRWLRQAQERAGMLQDFLGVLAGLEEFEQYAPQPIRERCARATLELH